MNSFKKYFLIFFSFISLLSFSPVFAEEDMLKEMRKMSMYGGMDGKGMRGITRVMNMQKLLSTRKEMKDAIAKIKQNLDELKQKSQSSAEYAEQIKDLKEDKSDQEKMLIEVNRFLGEALKRPGMADVIMKGIAGKDAGDSLDEIVIGSVEDVSGWTGEAKQMVKGAGYGALFRTSNSIGKELGTSIDRVVQGGFGTGTGVIIRFFRYINNIIFHSGYYPFEVDEIKSWQSLVINDMQSLEKMIKEGSKNESRSRDMIQRELGEDGDKENKEKAHFIWKDFADSFSEKCMFIVNEMSERKRYYGKKDLIVFYSSQLQKRLIAIAKRVLKMNSLKEFSTLGEVNSVLMPMRKNLNKLFEVLGKQVESTQSFLDKKSKSSFGSRDYSGSSGSDSSYVNTYPGSFDY